MLMKTIPATKASKQFGELIDAVQREPVMVEAGIAKGLADIDSGRFSDFTPKYAKDMAARFKARLKTA